MDEHLYRKRILFDPENPIEIAAAIEELITDADQRRRLATRGKELSRQYTWERCAHETFSFIAQTVELAKHEF